MGISFSFLGGGHWISSLAALWIVTAQINFLYFFLSGRSGKKDKVYLSLNVAGVGFGAGILSLFRRNVFAESLLVILLTLGLLLIVSIIRDKEPRTARVKLYCGLGLFLLLGGYAAKNTTTILWMVRDYQQKMESTFRNPQHPLWHVMYIGLGYVTNEKNIKWWDHTGNEHAQKVKPGIQYASSEYESLMRSMYFKEVIRRPTLLLRNMSAKFIELFSLYRYLLLVPFFIFLVLALQKSSYWFVGLLALLSFSVWGLGPILVHPAREYCLSLYLGTGLWSAVLFFMVFFDKQVRGELVSRFDARSYYRPLGLSALILSMPFIGYLFFYNSINNQPGLFWLTIESRDSQIMTADLRLEGETNEFTFTFPKGDKLVAAMSIKPWHYFKKKFQVRNISFYDSNNRLVQKVGSYESTRWSSYNIDVKNVDQGPVFTPKNADFGLFWRPEQEIRAKTVKIQIALL